MLNREISFGADKAALFRPLLVAPVPRLSPERLSFQPVSAGQSQGSQAFCQAALALTICFLSHGHQAVVGNIPQILGGLGQCQGIGCDGSCVGTQEPSTCLLPQELICLGDGGFLEESRGLSRCARLPERGQLGP